MDEFSAQCVALHRAATIYDTTPWSRESEAALFAAVDKLAAVKRVDLFSDAIANDDYEEARGLFLFAQAWTKTHRKSIKAAKKESDETA